MPAASAEIPKGFARDPRLHLGNGLDDQLRLADEIVKTAADDRIMASVNNYRSFEEISRRDAAVRGGFDRPRTGRRFRLVAEDRDQRGSVDDYRGKPRSS